MFGNISVLWQETQAQYFLEIGKENSGLRWTSKLIHNIWQVALVSRHTSRSSDDRISGPDGTGNWNTRTTSRR
jgi:hypothetical protein